LCEITVSYLTGHSGKLKVMFTVLKLIVLQWKQKLFKRKYLFFSALVASHKLTHMDYCIGWRPLNGRLGLCMAAG